MDGRKIYFCDDWERMIKLININTQVLKLSKKEEKTDKYDDYIERNEKIVEKLNKYKKVDSNGKIYLYVFPNELEDIMWILYENNIGCGLI